MRFERLPSVFGQAQRFESRETADLQRLDIRSFILRVRYLHRRGRSGRRFCVKKCSDKISHYSHDNGDFTGKFNKLNCGKNPFIV